MVVPWRLSPTAAVPWVAFFDGHPFRIRLHGAAHRDAGHRRGCAAGLSLLPRVRRLRAARWWCWRRGVRAATAGSPGADGRRSAVGSAECAGSRRRSRPASERRGPARRSWPAWDRSAITCRKRRGLASSSATSCTKATATSGSPRSPGPETVRRLDPDRGEGRRRRHARRAGAPRTRISWMATRGPVRVPDWRFTGGTSLYLESDIDGEQIAHPAQSRSSSLRSSGRPADRAVASCQRTSNPAVLPLRP